MTGYGSSYAGAPAGLGLPDGSTVTVSPMAGVARVFRGAPAVDDGLTVPVPEGCYGSSPAIARDGGDGAVWIAWLQWDCPQVGVFAARYDPATGAFSTPLRAPGSSWGSGGYPNMSLDDPVALSARGGRDGIWLAYESGERGDVALWRIGAAGATTIRRRADEARSVRLAADPGDGRLWVVWQEGLRYWVQRTTAAGVPDGAPRPVAVPRNDTGDLLRLDDLEISARGGASTWSTGCGAARRPARSPTRGSFRSRRAQVPRVHRTMFGKAAGVAADDERRRRCERWMRR